MEDLPHGFALFTSKVDVLPPERFAANQCLPIARYHPNLGVATQDSVFWISITQDCVYQVWISVVFANRPEYGNFKKG